MIEFGNKLSDFAEEIWIPELEFIDNTHRRKNILNDKTIQCKLIDDPRKLDLFKQNSTEAINEFENEVEKCMACFCYLTDLLPLLGSYDSPDSYNSDIMFEESSSDDTLLIKAEKPAFFDVGSIEPFPIYRYNKVRKNNYLSNQLIGKTSASNSSESVENFIPYYIMSYSYKIASFASYSIQKLFVINKYARIYILDQISFIIKEFRIDVNNSPK